MKKNLRNATLSFRSLIVAILFGSLALFTSCAKEDNLTPTNSQAIGNDHSSARESASEFLIVIKHGDGYGGRAPVYSVSVSNKGEVVFNGDNNVNKIGTIVYDLPLEQIEGIIQLAKESGFMDLQEIYPSEFAEAPESSTEINFSGDVRTVVDWGAGSPDELKKLKASIEEQLGINDYVGSN